MRFRLVLLLGFLALVLSVAACGGGDGGDEAAPTGTAEEVPMQGDAEAGKEVFTSAGCGGCHTLEAAGASGTSAPNLDEQDLSYDEVVEQVKNGGGGMPAFGDRLSEEEIANVAAFVVASSEG